MSILSVSASSLNTTLSEINDCLNLMESISTFQKGKASSVFLLTSSVSFSVIKEFVKSLFEKCVSKHKIQIRI